MIDKLLHNNYDIITYDRLRFEWNPVKAKQNLKKHAVSFEEAETVFYDENALLISDPDHSIEEDRFLLLGMSSKFHMLIVCHCYRENDLICLISARKADKDEIHQYEERL